jgi:hypothetical protein
LAASESSASTTRSSSVKCTINENRLELIVNCGFSGCQ